MYKPKGQNGYIVHGIINSKHRTLNFYDVGLYACNVQENLASVFAGRNIVGILCMK